MRRRLPGFVLYPLAALAFLLLVVLVALISYRQGLAAGAPVVQKVTTLHCYTFPGSAPSCWDKQPDLSHARSARK